MAMINVKDAVKNAAEYFTDLYHDQFTNVLLEEVELSDGYWLITLGYDRPASLPQFVRKGPRAFKVFKVDGETGEVISMKIREVEHVE
ncbi:MAG: hypothetical protein ABSF73_01955 [Terriglobia bacterium]|jgi:hypothetical protein